MEICDIYDAEGKPTGRAFRAGATLLPGELFFHVIAVLCNEEGLFLLQKRSMQKRYFPGRWDLTGGGAQHDEDGSAAVKRELCEELGLSLTDDNLLYRERRLTERYVLDVFGIRADFALSDLHLQASEVDEARLVPLDDFLAAVRHEKSDAEMALYRRAGEAALAGTGKR